MHARGIDKVWRNTEREGDEAPSWAWEVRECFRKRLILKMSLWGNRRSENGEGTVQTEGKPWTKAPRKCVACLVNSKQFAAPEASSYLLFPVRVYEKTLEREAGSRLWNWLSSKGWGESLKVSEHRSSLFRAALRRWRDVGLFRSCSGCWPLPWIHSTFLAQPRTVYLF